MTGEVTTLFGEMAEKGRLEQEMFAARGSAEAVADRAAARHGPRHPAFCEPAREVAGDYYDFLPITDSMIGC
jgi:hypothetical protein